MSEILVRVGHTLSHHSKVIEQVSGSVTSSNLQASAPIDYTSTACMFLDIVSTPFNNGNDIFNLRQDFTNHII